MNRIDKPEENTQVVHNIKAEVIFGSPGRGCAGSGVCKLIPIQKLKNWKKTCPRFDVTIEWYSNNCVDLTLNLTKLTNKDWLRWFSNPYFLVEEDFFFPLWAQHKMKHKKIYIPVGRYPFIIKNDQLKLFLPWQKDSSTGKIKIKQQLKVL